jgi:hypothetical protein
VQTECRRACRGTLQNELAADRPEVNGDCRRLKGKIDKTTIHVIDPLSDERWGELVERHPHASAFHHAAWLKALSCTYGYKSCVLTSSSAGEQLADGIVLCRVSSWITGTRLVSLPFSDHCELLFGSTDRSLEFMNGLRSECDRRLWKYVEVRPPSGFHGQEQGFQVSKSYGLHEINLGQSLEELFRGLHKNCIQRKIRRAEREGCRTNRGALSNCWTSSTVSC